MELGYIYVITNKINNKKYIGKTMRDPFLRWKEHLKQSKKDIKSPLYLAINKYGVQNFQMKILERVQECNINIREQYWIQYFDSYNTGYNATFGGDGVIRVNRENILKLFNKGYSQYKIANKIGCSRPTVSSVLDNLGITRDQKKKRGILSKGKSVYRIDLISGEIIEYFSSLSEADRSYGNNKSGSIGEVCKNKRQSAYGFSWRYVQDLPNKKIGDIAYEIFNKQVTQIDAVTKNIIGQYENASRAANAIGKPSQKSNISKACQQEGKLCAGSLWKYSKDL